MKRIFIIILFITPLLCKNNVVTESNGYEKLVIERGDLGYDRSSQMKISFFAFCQNIPEQHLYDLFKLESNHDHKAVNDSTLATGLIQFMPSTAIWLGTSIEELSNITTSEQLDWVFKYLEFYGPYSSFYDLYFAVFYPMARNKPLSYQIGGSKTASQNHGIDKDKDGRLFVREVYY